MRNVRIVIPAPLLQRLCSVAKALTPADVEHPLHLAVRCAAVEAVFLANEQGHIRSVPTRGVSIMAITVPVPEAAARSVALLAHTSGLTEEQAWHRVIWEFCARDTSPALTPPGRAA